jgi:transposase InsO family protein
LRRKKHVFTTDSAHTLPIYPNLARHATLSAVNQLWVADITFIRLRSEFIYLAVVLDAYSRRVIGWDLGRTLHAGLAIRALQMALSERHWKAEGLIHHSDRGIQYASSEYTDLLEQAEIQISISRRGNPYDNARAARPIRISSPTTPIDSVSRAITAFSSRRPTRTISSGLRREPRASWWLSCSTLTLTTTTVMP